MIDKYDETLQWSFSGFMVKYTMVFNQIKRSIYGRGYDAFNKILEWKRTALLNTHGNACFRKCLEYIQKGGFSNEFKESIGGFDKCNNIMTLVQCSTIF